MFDRVLNTPLENTRKQLGIQQKKKILKNFLLLLANDDLKNEYLGAFRKLIGGLF